MKLVVTCTVCGARMGVHERHIGHTGNCNKCGSVIAITSENVTSRESSVSTSGIPRSNEPDDKNRWKQGDVILDLYEVKDLLGEGGMGRVYRVYHRHWDIELAVKCPKRDLLEYPHGADNFERECETWINLGLYPYIVSCYYVRKIDDVPRIFAEYLPGGNLWQWIQDGRLYAGGIEPALERIIRVGIQTAWGLHHAHTLGVVHRDMKPSNILLTNEGTAKITDFGLATALEIASANAADRGGEVKGGMTPAYCSPEQANHENITLKTDIWSWALCVLQMFSRKLTWAAGQDAQKGLERYLARYLSDSVLPKMPAELVQLLSQCMMQQPERRPASMIEIANALQSIYYKVTGAVYPYAQPKPVEALAQGLNNKAVSMLDLGRRHDAIQLWNQALKADAKHVESTYNFGLIRWRAGRTTDARLLDRLQEVSDLHPQDPTALLLMTHVHIERGDAVSALQLLDTIQTNFPNGPNVDTLIDLASEQLPQSRRLACSLDAHADAIGALCLFPDGKHAVTGSEDNTVKLWNLETRQCIRVYQGHTGSVESVWCSADTKEILSVSRDRTMRLWDTARGTCLRIMEGHREAANAACLFPDANFIFARGSDETVVLVDVKSGKVVRMYRGHRDSVNAVAVTTVGHIGASAGQDGLIKLWDLRGGDCVRTLEGHEGPVTCVGLNSDGSCVLSGGEDKTIRFWHSSTTECVLVLKGHQDRVSSICLSKNGKSALSGSKDATVRFWDLHDGRCLRTFDLHNSDVRGVAINDAVTRGVSVSKDMSLKIWNLGGNLEAYCAPYALCRAVRSEAAVLQEMNFNRSLDHARAAIKRRDAAAAANYLRQARAAPTYRRNGDAMRLWGRLYVHLPKKAFSGAWEAATLLGHEGKIEAVCVSADGRWIASAGADGSVRLWDQASGKCRHVLSRHTSAVKSISMSDDAQLIVSGGEDQALLLWDTSQGEVAQKFEGQMGSVECVALSPDLRYMVSGGWELKLWEVATGSLVRAFEGHTADITTVSWGPDGRTLMSGSSDETIRIWDFATGQSLAVLKGQGGVVRGLNVSGAGRFVIAGTAPLWGKSGQVRMWNLLTGESKSFLDGHTASITDSSLTADDRFAFTASADATFRLWDLSTLSCVKVFQGHEGSISSVAVSKDSRVVVSAGIDGVVKSWFLDWALENRAMEYADESINPYLENFLALHTPLPTEPTEFGLLSTQDLVVALTRRGKPVWDENDFAKLCQTLGYAGFGWVNPESVQVELERLVSKRSGISGIFRRMGR